MKKFWTSLLLMGLVLVLACGCGSGTDYQDKYAEAGKLYQSGEYASSAAILAEIMANAKDSDLINNSRTLLIQMINEKLDIMGSNLAECAKYGAEYIDYITKNGAPVGMIIPSYPGCQELRDTAVEKLLPAYQDCADIFAAAAPAYEKDIKLKAVNDAFTEWSTAVLDLYGNTEESAGWSYCLYAGMTFTGDTHFIDFSNKMSEAGDAMIKALEDL